MASKKDTTARADGLRIVYSAIPPKDFAALNRLAKESARTRAAQVRVIISEYFAARRDAQTEAAR